MKFNSWVFLVFFLLVYGLYYIVGKKHYRNQNYLLLVASYIFYGWWDARFLLLIALSTAIDYTCAYLISYGAETRKILKRVFFFLGSSIVAFLAIDWNGWKARLFDGDFGLPGTYQIADTGWLFAFSFACLFLLLAAFYFICGFSENRRRKTALVFSVVANLTILGFFKYFDFFSNSFAEAWHSLAGQPIDNLTLGLILPVGISFYTFQTMSYTIDVYRNELKASRSFLDLAVYVAFFPQLVAGPIERGKHLLPQFARARKVNHDDFRSGMWLIVWGLYKKIVIADNLAIIVNRTFEPFDAGDFSNISDVGGLTCLAAIVAFAFQIYGDFSGYTDIARGTSRLMGFDIMSNFNVPYISRSPSEFWSRWHISLSTWLRDYLYIPLGGNRSGSLGTYRNLFLVMLLGGLWHGAAWTFVIWGVFHGTILIIYRLFFPGNSIKSYKGAPWWKLFVEWLVMWNLTLFGWLIFRAQNLRTIYEFSKSIFTDISLSMQGIDDFKSIGFYIWFLLIFQIIKHKTQDIEPLKRLPSFIRFNVWLFVIFSLLFLHPAISQEFIYFAF